jgi:hypothetical protein
MKSKGDGGRKRSVPFAFVTFAFVTFAFVTFAFVPFAFNSCRRN